MWSGVTVRNVELSEGSSDGVWGYFVSHNLQTCCSEKSVTEHFTLNILNVYSQSEVCDRKHKVTDMLFIKNLKIHIKELCFLFAFKWWCKVTRNI